MRLNDVVAKMAGNTLEIEESPRADRADFVVGARVIWVDKTMTGTSIRLTERTSRITAMEGDIAIIQHRGKRRRVHWSRLSLAAR